MSFNTEKDVSLLENCLTNFKIFSFNVKNTQTYADFPILKEISCNRVVCKTTE